MMTSCEWFAPGDVKTRKLVELEMQSINWEELDQYPLFDNCDEMAGKQEQKLCFERTLLDQFTRTLNDFEFVLDTTVQDTLYLDFLITHEGELQVLDIEHHEKVAHQIPEFEGVIIQSLKALPRPQPALKRGIPVSAKFRIPMIIETEDQE
ncbi:MAG: hypothetical protein KJO90_04820 [Eudoraea sp.]|nr:hypothetical protein [Eudoraea sp.]